MSFKYRVIIYQLLGNNKDGYEVNDAYSSNYTMEFKDHSFDDNSIIKELKSIGFLNKHLRNKSIEIDGDENNLYINYTTSRVGLMPICELRREA